MDTLFTIMLSIAIYSLISSIIEAVVTFVKTSNKKTIGTIGFVLNAIILMVWRTFIPQESSPIYYIGLVLLITSAIFSAVNVLIGLLSCDGRY